MSIYAELTQLVGWLLFNTGSYATAQQHYEEARAVAHEAENAELVTYILCTMSHLATWQGKPRVGIDHAVAAATWATQTDSPKAQGYAADVAVRAFLAAGQEDKCVGMLQVERSALDRASTAPEASWWYFFDDSFYWRTESEYALGIESAARAHQAIDRSLDLVDSTNLHNYAFRLLFRSEAHLLDGEAGEAARLIGDVADMTSVNGAHRIDQRIIHLRNSLATRGDSHSLAELDERLAIYRPSARI